MKHIHHPLTIPIIVLVSLVLLAGQAQRVSSQPGAAAARSAAPARQPATSLAPVSRPLAAGGGIAYTYDAAGRLVRTDYAGGKSIAYTYDNAGNLTQRQVTSRALLYLPVILRR
jgi:YD repeat-containing protein